SALSRNLRAPPSSSSMICDTITSYSSRDNADIYTLAQPTADAPAALRTCVPLAPSDTIKSSSYMLRFETAGESHGECLVAILTGLPAGVPVSVDAINHQLWRRQQGYGRGGRMKI